LVWVVESGAATEPDRHRVEVDGDLVQPGGEDGGRREPRGARGPKPARELGRVSGARRLRAGCARLNWRGWFGWSVAPPIGDGRAADCEPASAIRRCPGRNSPKRVVKRPARPYKISRKYGNPCG